METITYIFILILFVIALFLNDTFKVLKYNLKTRKDEIREDINEDIG